MYILFVIIALRVGTQYALYRTDTITRFGLQRYEDYRNYPN